jgi:hypothetical protein
VCVCERFFVADIELILDCAFIGVAFEWMQKHENNNLFDTHDTRSHKQQNESYEN